MASSVDTVQYICDQAGLGRRLTHRKMFGEYALYVDDKVVAFVCDDQLFLKPTAQGRAFLGHVVEAPPYPTAKNHFLLSTELDEPERLSGALLITADSLPLPRPRRPKATRAKAKRKKS